jgi:hypothetical protein
MSYKVIREGGFKDFEDNRYQYQYGDKYPRDGYETTDKRIKELSSTNNKLNTIIIEKVEDEKPKISKSKDKSLDEVTLTDTQKLEVKSE